MGTCEKKSEVSKTSNKTCLSSKDLSKLYRGCLALDRGRNEQDIEGAASKVLGLKPSHHLIIKSGKWKHDALTFCSKPLHSIQLQPWAIFGHRCNSRRRTSHRYQRRQDSRRIRYSGFT